MKKATTPIFFTCILLAIFATYQYKEREFDKVRLHYIHQIELARNKGWKQCEDHFEKNVVPFKMDSAFTAGDNFRDSIWRDHLPELIFIADSTATEKAWVEAELFFSCVIEDTTQILLDKMDEYGMAQKIVGYHQGLEEQKKARSGSVKIKKRWIFSAKGTFLNDQGVRFAISILSLAMGGGVVHFLKFRMYPRRLRFRF